MSGPDERRSSSRDDDALVVKDAPDPATAAVTPRYRLANVVGSLAVVAMGLVLLVGGLGLPAGQDGVPGPGLFPDILGALLVGLGGLQLALSALGHIDRGEDSTLPDRVGAQRLGITAVATVVMILALPWVGYVVAMTAFVLVLLLLVGRRPAVQSVLVAVSFGAGSFYAFTLGLGLHLPTAYLPFLRVLGI